MTTPLSSQPLDTSLRPPAAGRVTYKRALRKEIQKRAQEPEINFLNITAMMDMMTIILVFLLKSMSSSSASIPESPDLQIPKSVLMSEASQEGVKLVITKAQIFVDDTPICKVPANATLGVEAKYKRSGQNDLYIVPLANALKSWRERDRQVQAALGKSSGGEAIVVADASIPYRLLTEIFYTAGQAEFSKYHLMTLQSAKK